MNPLEPQSHTPGGRPDHDRAGESVYGAQKRGTSPRTKKRLAETNALHYDLQKQRGIELREMIPEAFVKMAKNVLGSNREMIHTLNATKLYITSLLDDNARLEELVEKLEGQTTYSDVNHGNGNTVAESGQASQSHSQGVDATTRPKKRAVVGISPSVALSRVHSEHGAFSRMPDISPHDSFLRQAVERLIALTKGSVMANQGVLDKKQIDRLNAVHDCIVEMVEEISRG